MTKMARELASVLAFGAGVSRPSGQVMMRNLKGWLLVVTIFSLSNGMLANDVKVIANPSLHADSISASELRSVFLEERTSLGGEHVEPVLAKSGLAHEFFLRQYLRLSDADLQTYYRSLVFTGRGSTPKALNSDAEVVAWVAKTRGAIGYVSADARGDGVRTLVVTSGKTAERKLISRVEPDYPGILRERSIGGTVRLRVTIAPTGAVTDVVVIGGDAALGEAAAAAVAWWRYAPASSRTSTEVTITFDPQR